MIIENLKQTINSAIDDRITIIKNYIHQIIINGNNFDNICLIAFMTCLTLNIMDVPYAKKFSGIILAIYLMIKFLVVVFI